jgi:hypothetical protein
MEKRAGTGLTAKRAFCIAGKGGGLLASLDGQQQGC